MLHMACFSSQRIKRNIISVSFGSPVVCWFVSKGDAILQRKKNNHPKVCILHILYDFTHNFHLHKSYLPACRNMIELSLLAWVLFNSPHTLRHTRQQNQKKTYANQHIQTTHRKHGNTGEIYDTRNRTALIWVGFCAYIWISVCVGSCIWYVAVTDVQNKWIMDNTHTHTHTGKTIHATFLLYICTFMYIYTISVLYAFFDVLRRRDDVDGSKQVIFKPYISPREPLDSIEKATNANQPTDRPPAQTPTKYNLNCI